MAGLRRNRKILTLSGEFKITDRKHTYEFELENGDTGSVRITKNMKLKIYSDDGLITKAQFRCNRLRDTKGTLTGDDDEFFSPKEKGLHRRSIYKAIKRNETVAEAKIVHERDTIIEPDPELSYLPDIKQTKFILEGFDFELAENENDPFQQKFGDLFEANWRKDSGSERQWTIDGWGSEAQFECDW